jgi:hypothetical protein
MEIELYSGIGSGARLAMAKSDEAGVARFNELPAGEYLGATRRIDLRPSRFRAVVAAGYVDTLELHPGTRTP